MRAECEVQESVLADAWVGKYAKGFLSHLLPMFLDLISRYSAVVAEQIPRSLRNVFDRRIEPVAPLCKTLTGSTLSGGNIRLWFIGR